MHIIGHSYCQVIQMPPFMKTNKLNKVFLIIGCMFWMHACGLLQPSVSAPVPDEVETIIVKTAAAAQTQTSEFLPPTKQFTKTATATRIPSSTPRPTSTILFFAPTKTQTFLTPPTGTSETGTPTETPTGTPVIHNYEGKLACALVKRSPSDGTIFSPRNKFTARWTIKNTGTASWKKGLFYYRYLGGDKFHDRGEYDIKTILDPGETIVLNVEMYAPKSAGSYQTTWVVGTDSGGLCKMTLAIVVE